MKLIIVLALMGLGSAAAEPPAVDRVPSLDGPPALAFVLRPPDVDAQIAIAPPALDPGILLGPDRDLLAEVTAALSRAMHWLVPLAT